MVWISKRQETACLRSSESDSDSVALPVEIKRGDRIHPSFFVTYIQERDRAQLELQVEFSNLKFVAHLYLIQQRPDISSRPILYLIQQAFF
jgi:hypothetical protein